MEKQAEQFQFGIIQRKLQVTADEYKHAAQDAQEVFTDVVALLSMVKVQDLQKLIFNANLFTTYDNLVCQVTSLSVDEDNAVKMILRAFIPDGTHNPPEKEYTVWSSKLQPIEKLCFASKLMERMEQYKQHDTDDWI